MSLLKKNNFTIFANTLLEFSSAIIIALFIGYLLDKIFNTRPIFIIIFLFLGLISGIMNILRFVKKL